MTSGGVTYICVTVVITSGQVKCNILTHHGFIFVTEIVNGEAQYMMAKALIITFVINNHLSDQDNEPAIAWEKA